MKLLCVATTALWLLGLGTTTAQAGGSAPSKTRLYFRIDIDAAIREAMESLAAELQDGVDARKEAITIKIAPKLRIVAVAKEHNELRAFSKRVAAKYRATLLQKTGKRRVEITSAQARTAAIRRSTKRSMLYAAERRAAALLGKNKAIRVTAVKGALLCIEMPQLGAKKRAEFIRRFTDPAQLEFRLVDDLSSLPLAIAKKLKPKIPLKKDHYDGRARGTINYVYFASTKQARLVRFLKNLRGALAPPPNREFLVGAALDSKPGAKLYASYYLHRRPVLSGNDVSSAQISWTTGAPGVSVVFKAKAAAAFESFTQRHIGWRLAIVLNGRVDSAPILMGAIKGGRARISLDGTKDPFARQKQALALANRLTVGTLTTRLKFLREESITSRP